VKGTPYLLLIVPLEGRTRAVLVCDSLEDEERLALDVEQRSLLLELAEALIALFDALGEGGST
jgi:hypothetical protein